MRRVTLIFPFRVGSILVSQIIWVLLFIVCVMISLMWLVSSLVMWGPPVMWTRAAAAFA